MIFKYSVVATVKKRSIEQLFDIKWLDEKRWHAVLLSFQRVQR